ncbi:palmitoyltransferase ZDHHC4-like [Coregonus clupeaformis]|uniref:palmitoyltransferase ZDHHC4-like n=1 Tax=Coregonus clupeaformis TaxID=59861 RepID=UPI001BDFCD59|nr:palmitoyltransferase ZDHHC4-like [Coregonus clupeaformis]
MTGNTILDTTMVSKVYTEDFVLFHQRNSMFIYFHILLEGAVYTEITYEVFGYCKDMDTTLTSLSVPLVLLVVESCSALEGILVQ